jgi:D-3-phosphoglycerate dehydrogenase
MIGKVTLSLGNNNINIASMQVGRKKKGGFQLMVLRVDQKIPGKVINLIKKINGVVDTLSVDL